MLKELAPLKRNLVLCPKGDSHPMKAPIWENANLFERREPGLRMRAENGLCNCELSGIRLHCKPTAELRNTVHNVLVLQVTVGNHGGLFQGF